jgi:hypothetical protein
VALAVKNVVASGHHAHFALLAQWLLPGLHAALRDDDDSEVIIPASCLLSDELVDEVHLRKTRHVY